MTVDDTVLPSQAEADEVLLPTSSVVGTTLREDLVYFRDLLIRDYLNSPQEQRANTSATDNLDLLKIIKFSEIRFRKNEDLHMGMQSLLTAISRYLLPFIFILRRTEEGIYALYMGLWGTSAEQTIKLQDSFSTIPSSVLGFLPGCQFEDMDDCSVAHEESKREVWKSIRSIGTCRVLTGIPSEKGNQQKSNDNTPQRALSIERLADSGGYPFAVVVYAEPLSHTVLNNFRDSVEFCANEIHRYVKVTRQSGHNWQNSEANSVNVTESDSDSFSKTSTDGKTLQMQPLSFYKTVADNCKKVFTGGEKSSYQRQTSTAETEQRGHSASLATGTTLTNSSGETDSQSFEKIEKSAQNIEEILNRHLKRFDQGQGTGFWQCLTSVFSDNDVHADEMSNLFRGMLSGDSSADDPVRVIKVPQNTTHLNAPELVQLSPQTPHPFGLSSPQVHALTNGIFTQLNTKELALIVSLPQYELPGIFVEELVEYGRAWRTKESRKESPGVDLGFLIDRNQCSKNKVHLSREKLQRHCFVSGATGSGKSTTVKHLLRHLWKDCHIPFLVIEPVKSEYQSLHEELGDDLRFFRLGDSDFSLNPFEFEEGLLLTSHLDILKATFNASLGMYSSMPFVLEHILYTVYEHKGWDLITGENRYLTALQDAGLTRREALRKLCYPALGDTLPLVRNAIQHFFGEAQTDYSGSLTGALHARLSSLIRGTKGQVLNRCSSRPFEDLLSKPCIIELSNFSDNDEKAFIMALLMTRLYEHRQAEERAGSIPPNTLRHVLIIEEAHRLLSKPSPSGEHAAQGRQKGVEVFADILAEIRSYGQGLIVVDQIPSKLIPDVLRNTDIKIAHRIVDKEDRELIGATMNLDEKQIKELARFAPGESCVYFSGLRKALCVKIDLGQESAPPLPGGQQDKGKPRDTRQTLLLVGAIFWDVYFLKEHEDFQAAHEALRAHMSRAYAAQSPDALWEWLQEGIIDLGHILLREMADEAGQDTSLTQDVLFAHCCDTLCLLTTYCRALWEGDVLTMQRIGAELVRTCAIQSVVISKILDELLLSDTSYRHHKNILLQARYAQGSTSISDTVYILQLMRAGLLCLPCCVSGQCDDLATFLGEYPLSDDLFRAALTERLKEE